MSDNNTLDYYNLHTADFVNTTQNVDFHEIQELFLSFLPAKAKILDFGCGSGRDTKYFIDNGYEVDAMDGSKELCKAATKYTGIQVHHISARFICSSIRYFTGVVPNFRNSAYSPVSLTLQRFATSATDRS